MKNLEKFKNLLMYCVYGTNDEVSDMVPIMLIFLFIIIAVVILK